MSKFTIIGENIHATRVLRLNGKRVGLNEDGVESVIYNKDGVKTFMTIPEEIKKTQPYQQGQAKHFMIAIWKGIFGNSDQIEDGAKYVINEIKRQEKYNSDFLDLNVDEMSHKLDIQIQAMKWLMGVYQENAKKPPSVDSSNSEIIEAGLKEYNGKQGRPMINSIALERLETFELAKEYNAQVILTGASKDGMPSDSSERVNNINEIINHAKNNDISYQDIHLDPLVFPISVDKEYGGHFFEAISKLREIYGSEINISGGLSNVSFGLPRRKLVNDVFVKICINNGLDSGIIDPIQIKIDEIKNLDESTEDYKVAENMLMGRDDFCMNYITYCRQGSN